MRLSKRVLIDATSAGGRLGGRFAFEIPFRQILNLQDSPFTVLLVCRCLVNICETGALQKMDECSIIAHGLLNSDEI